MKRFVMFAIKRTISMFAANVVIKKIHEIERDESDEPTNQSHYTFFI